MNKAFTSLFLILLIALPIVSSIGFSGAQTYKEVNGIINSDTTWTKANSPYNLTGPILINYGVTLTIEPGVTVNFGNNYMKVNGTLFARGTSAEKIYFNGEGGLPGEGSIFITRFSPAWNDQTNSGSIIENAIINFKSIGMRIGATSPKINNNTITGTLIAEDEYGLLIGSPIITNNIITQNGYGLALQLDDSPIIQNNTINGGITSEGSLTVISNNIIQGEAGNGIQTDSSQALIFNNVISGFGTGIRAGRTAVIQNNLINNNQNGILLWINADPEIRNNTIVNNVNGISLPGYLGEPGGGDIQVNYNRRTGVSAS